MKKGINFSVIISSLLVGSVFIIGVICFVIGVKDTYELNTITKDYSKTTGYFTDYTVFSSDEDGITYQLIYRYQIDGKTYTVSTDYGSEYIPENGSTRAVKYNPANPEEAILEGANSKNGLIYFGAFFMLGASVFILFALQILGVFDKAKIDVLGVYFGFVFFLIGIGILLLQRGMTSSWPEVVKALRLWILIPILFILTGAFQMWKSAFGVRQKKKKK